MEVLENRLRGRGSEKEEDIIKRLGNAADELAYGKVDGNFDRVFVNDDLDSTFSEMMKDFQAWYPQLRVSCNGTDYSDVDNQATSNVTDTINACHESAPSKRPDENQASEFESAECSDQESGSNSTIEADLGKLIERRTANVSRLMAQAQEFEHPKPLVISGPSGVGKGTLIEMLVKKFPEKFDFCIPHTTRPRRVGEIDGIHYNFTSVKEMMADIKAGKFIEYAEVQGNYYGTR